MANRHFLIEDRFFDSGEKLRATFDKRFAKPLEGSSARFVWDYWHVPNQYTLIRTPALEYFPKNLSLELVRHLLAWGRENLGCHSISPPWLSYYVDGCGQDFHADVPHGPWAFVYSLTRWRERRFSGGETMLLKPETLDLWRTQDFDRGQELPDLLDLVEPQFNRLTVFDPRIPHGVRPVNGTRDPRESRLVIHGWFTEPGPFVAGALSRKEFERGLSEQLPRALENLDPNLKGILVFRLKVVASGKIANVKCLNSTLISSAISTTTSAGSPHVNAIIKRISQSLERFRFSQSAGVSVATIPLIFKS